MKLDKPKPGARSISLAEFIGCLKTSSQIEEELTTSVPFPVARGHRCHLLMTSSFADPSHHFACALRQAVKEIWLATLSFDLAPDMVTEDDKNLEVSLLSVLLLHVDAVTNPTGCLAHSAL